MFKLWPIKLDFMCEDYYWTILPLPYPRLQNTIKRKKKVKIYLSHSLCILFLLFLNYNRIIITTTTTLPLPLTPLWYHRHGAITTSPRPSLSNLSLSNLRSTTQPYVNFVTVWLCLRRLRRPRHRRYIVTILFVGSAPIVKERRGSKVCVVMFFLDLTVEG